MPLRSSNPNVYTGRAWTEHTLAYPIPPDATPEWLYYVTTTQELFRKLAYHDAMKPNIDQTFNTPAANKNNVYFMWDSIMRTLFILYNELPFDDSADDTNWEYYHMRNHLMLTMLFDQPKLCKMTEASYPEQRGKHPEFGREIIALAQKLKDGLPNVAEPRGNESKMNMIKEKMAADLAKPPHVFTEEEREQRRKEKAMGL